MITPTFGCTQNDEFVVVDIYLSIMCKVMSAVFDIVETQFTFYCSPYYLRLRFDQQLCEGRGEGATYNLEQNLLSVRLPKAVVGEHFTSLDNPAYLIATNKQRKLIEEVVGGANNNEEHAQDAGDDGEDDDRAAEEDETEYVQTLRHVGGESGAQTSTEEVRYGFGNAFSGLFARVDPDIVSDMMELPTPELTTAQERRELRIRKENADFSEEVLLLAFEDAEGEVAEVLRYVPTHLRDFAQALKSDSVVFAQLPSASAHAPTTTTTTCAGMKMEEESEDVTLLPGDGAPVPVWTGNVAEFSSSRVMVEEIEPCTSAPAETSSPAHPDEAATISISSSNIHTTHGRVAPLTGRQLAVPKQKPNLIFTKDELDVLGRVKLPALLFPPSTTSVAALTADLLFAEAYDALFTGESGCSESVWNLCTLSPALSYLDPADNLYDACVFFTRRILIYPLTPHLDVARRVLAVAGTRMLLGKVYVLRALMRVRSILSHSEHKHILSTIFLDPLIAYWVSAPNADARLQRMALEIHAHATRSTEEVEEMPPSNTTSALFVLPTRRTLHPITLLTLGLPLEED